MYWRSRSVMCWFRCSPLHQNSCRNEKQPLDRFGGAASTTCGKRICTAEESGTKRKIKGPLARACQSVGLNSVAVPLAGFVVFVATVATVAICSAGYCHHYSKREKDFFHRHLMIVKLPFAPRHVGTAGRHVQCSGLSMEGNTSSNRRSNTKDAHLNLGMIRVPSNNDVSS